MEIKQLEYFVAAADYGSLNRAAEQLYTTQPNVSKVIGALERELNTSLFERNNRGIRMTPQGKLLYSHAVSILKHAHIIRGMNAQQCLDKFSVSGYQSSLLTGLFAELYNQREEGSARKYEYREGTVEEITDHVSSHISELGIVYVAKSQLTCFNHIISHKNLEFQPLADRGVCVYLGERHPLYGEQSVDFSQLAGLKFMEGTEDFFAMEHHIDHIRVGARQMDNLNNVFLTNSDYMINNLLMHTDICCLGIDLVPAEYQKYAIKALKVRNCEPFLTIGYVKLSNTPLSALGQCYIDQIRTAVEEIQHRERL